MAYLDLILRSITEPGLLQIFINFLLIDDKFDGQRIIDVLIDRLHSTDSRVRIYHYNTILNYIIIYFLNYIIALNIYFTKY